mmetsp:Transcript_6677/g.12550  ORF Transcript_6677/g.12550 Transcript_6677/m.12550 type:complete len:455 (-) Transcript_6677:88-1452(-)|eukprot:CAMPEP_0176495666 /NCGR_PEP_ID=MMETSP0200_2-20121128/10782_1 /TAXON_ID=947934 /ORGANISM="Chaetoceros sp., Strain GSL56" /LENGTH=454 /DNA_ID=CAMNT_0017893567 /DNA_START=487 /DNA_END=1847 /DNA_ORIENTATION=-
MLRKPFIKSSCSQSESSNSQNAKDIGHNNNNSIATNSVDSVHLRSKLVKSMFSQKWKRVRQFLKTKVAIEQVKSFDSFKGVTILSIASSLNPPADVIKILLSIEPLHSLQVDTYGMLPLHIACMNGASSDSIEALLNHDDGACVQAIDMFKRTPLHYAVQYICEPGDMSTIESHGSSVSEAYPNHNNSQNHQPHDPLSANPPGNGIDHDEGINHNGILSAAIKDKQRRISGPILQFAQRGQRSHKCSSHTSQVTMSQEGFQDQIRVIQLLSEAGPEIVMHADNDGRTPIDILQDCKAFSKEGSKWERADIICEFLRNVAIRVYREQKIVAEMQGYRPIEIMHSQVAYPSSQASTSHNSYVSGATNLSKMEIDCTSYDCMNVSVSGEAGGGGRGERGQGQMKSQQRETNNHNYKMKEIDNNANMTDGKQQQQQRSGGEKNVPNDYDHLDVDMQSV